MSREDFVAVVLDGKTFADATMVIALGNPSGQTGVRGFHGAPARQGVSDR